MNFFNVPDEFKKNPELNEEDLNHLREWISKQPHLPIVTGKYTYVLYLSVIEISVIPIILFVLYCNILCINIGDMKNVFNLGHEI